MPSTVRLLHDQNMAGSVLHELRARGGSPVPNHFSFTRAEAPRPVPLSPPAGPVAAPPPSSLRSRITARRPTARWDRGTPFPAAVCGLVSPSTAGRSRCRGTMPASR